MIHQWRRQKRESLNKKGKNSDIHFRSKVFFFFYWKPHIRYGIISVEFHMFGKNYLYLCSCIFCERVQYQGYCRICRLECGHVAGRGKKRGCLVSSEGSEWGVGKLSFSVCVCVCVCDMLIIIIIIIIIVINLYEYTAVVSLKILHLYLWLPVYSGPLQQNLLSRLFNLVFHQSFIHLPYLGYVILIVHLSYV